MTGTCRARSARSAADLADELYRSGSRNLLQALDARRAQVAVEDDLLLARQAALARTVDLYRALGGGWEEIGLDGSLSERTAARTEEGR